MIHPRALARKQNHIAIPLASDFFNSLLAQSAIGAACFAAYSRRLTLAP
jgi:hypothetical protein